MRPLPLVQLSISLIKIELYQEAMDCGYIGYVTKGVTRC